MKKLYNFLSISALGGVLCLSLPINANAQHRDNGGGGGSSAAPAPRQSAPAQSAPAPRQSAPAQSFSRPAPAQSSSRPSPSQGFTRQPNQTRYNNNGVQRYNNRTNGVVQRNTNVTTRPYTGHGQVSGGSTQAYRSYQGSAYGHNSPGYSGVRTGYLPGRAYYHYNRGYYGSYYAPRLGFSIGYLPYGYYPFYFGDYQYFYSDGLYYQYTNDQYTVVEPPVGAEVKTLPSNAQSIVINGQQYYEVNGVYYEPITKDDGTLSYQIAGKDGELNTDDQGENVDNAPPAPQIGDIISKLPPNCRKININGDKLYLSQDGIYYKAQLDQDNNKVYQIVGLPADDNQPQPQQGN